MLVNGATVMIWLMKSGHSRVLMLGLDALDFRLFDELMAAGKLPNLAAFAGQSERLEVESDGAILHGSLWPTFASGTGPGTHGVYFWVQWLAEEMRHVRNNHPAFAFDPFWTGLPAAGCRATIVDVPFVPAARVEGLRHFIGWGLHDEIEAYAWPEAFGRQVVKRLGRHPLSFDTVEPQTLRDKLVMARDMRRGVHLRTKLVREILKDGTETLVVTTFGELHKAGHYLAASQQLSSRYTNADAIAAILQPLDAAWPGIVAAAGPDTHVFLFALHGTQEQVPFDEFGSQIASLLNGKEPVDPAAHPDLIRRVRDLVPDALHRAIWKRLPPSVRARRQGQQQGHSSDLAVDKLMTVAHDQHPAFRINLRGRERDGVVDQGGAEDLFRELAILVAQVNVEDGARAFSELWRPAEHTHGPRLDRLPDVLLVANPGVKRANRLEMPGGRTLRSLRTEARNGVHTGRGFCYFRPAGGVHKARRLVNTVDFAPTVLQLLGLPQRPGLEGVSFVE
jgi:predicted AlkP superfamily phosphohydrolase/phosphomutase